MRLIGSVVHGFASLELAGSFDHSDPPPDRTWPRILDGVALTASVAGEKLVVATATLRQRSTGPTRVP